MNNINTLVLHRVVKGQIENFEDITFQTLVNILKNESMPFYTIDSAFNKENQAESSICLTFDDGFSSDVDIVLPELQGINAAATFFIVKDYLGKEGYMTKDQVIKLSNNNMQIGSHSLTHPNFLNISSKRKTEELVYSKKFLEDLTSKEVTTSILDFIGKNIKKLTHPASSMLEIRIIKPATYLDPYLVLDSKLCICAI